MSNKKYFYVDESGTAEIFNRKGNVIVGNPGCSRYFILGFLDIGYPDKLRVELNDLRAGLLKDTYFKNVPSMQPVAKKTTVLFHAKDDVQEVRREVFKLLRGKKDLKFIAIVKDKMKVVEYAINRRNVIVVINTNRMNSMIT